ncbi:hypothetical protein ACIBBE_46925 [Streptomyces sp. NPDC051644]|uniref:hypothetical protein n=1 Tax=Streptomyces sp. NPDC051644 TaxID=3365666 RepID=UPI0037AE5777
MTTERLVDELLFWALDASGGDTTCDLGPHTGVDPSRLPFPDEEAVQQAASALEVQGWARGFRNAAGDVVYFRLTSVGVQEAERRRKATASRRERLVYTEDALLTWVFETAEVGRPVELIDFINSPMNFFYASALTADEVDAASRNLVGLKMLSTTGGPLTGVRLEPEGTSCVMSGQPVRAYKQLKAVHLEQHIHPGAVGAQGVNVDQHLGNSGSRAS